MTRIEREALREAYAALSRIQAPSNPVDSRAQLIAHAAASLIYRLASNHADALPAEIVDARENLRRIVGGS